MSFVFVSYPQAIRSDVERLVEKIAASGLDVFWDKDLGPGEWEKQLVKKLEDAAAMIVVVNSEVVERGTGSYVFKEVKIAVDQGYEMILPIELGDINLDGDIAPLLSKYQMIRARDLDDLLLNNDLQRHVTAIKGYIDAGGREVWSNSVTAFDTSAAGWPVNGEDLLERQALALAIALFEGELPFLITDAARSIADALAVPLRRETREEREQRPRAFVARPFTEQLASVGAERIKVSAGYHAAQDVVRFKDPNQQRRLLEYLWKEQPQVRRIMVSWIKSILSDGLGEGLSRRISKGLSHLAQIDLPGMDYEFLSEWFSINPAKGRQTLVESELIMASTLLASAFSVKGNRDLIIRQIEALSNGDTLPPPLKDMGTEAALLITLGALGQRAPDLAVSLLKKKGRSLKIGRGWKWPLCRRVLRSSLVWGEDPPDDARLAQYDAHGESKEEEGASLASEFEEAREAKANAGTDGATETIEYPIGPDETPETGDNHIADDHEHRSSRGLPAADFLADLARWIDAPISDPKKLYDRQIGLWVFLSVFERMPVYAKAAPNRLSLEDLVDLIGKKEPFVLETIVQALVRSARARPQPTSQYGPFRHLQNVIRSFAQKRAQSDFKVGDETDPLLRFARRVFLAIEEAEPGCGDYVPRGAARFMTVEELEFIEGKTETVTVKEET